MRIERAEVFVTSPGRNFVTLKIVAEDGVTGLGDATLNGRELAVAAYLRDHVCPTLIGRDAHRIEDTWQFLYRGSYWRRGPVTMTAIAAVDMALWDIKAKLAGMPLYQLLGGASRHQCLAYGHARGRTIDELMESIRAHIALGYSAVRIQVEVPGLSSSPIYDPSRAASQTYEAALAGTRPSEELWDTSAYLRYMPEVFETVRAEFGLELVLLHDVHHRLTPMQAARLGQSLEQYDLFWLEDVTPAENQEALRIVRNHTTVPLAIGEVFNTIWDYQVLIREQLIDYVRSPVTHGGGITAMRKILDYAGMNQVRSGMHGPSDISPIGMSAALHLDLAIHNFGIQEFMGYGETTLDVFQPSYVLADGYLHPGDRPGLGVSFAEEIASRYEYRPAVLPVSRTKDGTLHEW